LTSLPPVQSRFSSTELARDLVAPKWNGLNQPTDFRSDHDESSLGMFLAFCHERLSPSRRKCEGVWLASE
jgi:hypothetical protein